MKTTMKTGVIVFGLSMIMCAGIAWLAGFDFDRRGSDVVGYALFALGVSVLFTVFVLIAESEGD